MLETGGVKNWRRKPFSLYYQLLNAPAAACGLFAKKKTEIYLPLSEKKI